MATDSEILKQLHSRLRGNFKTKWDKDCDVNCEWALRRLLADYGAERLQQSVDAVIRHEEFFVVAKLEKHIPKGEVAIDSMDKWRAELKAKGETGEGLVEFFGDPRVKELMEKFKNKAMKGTK